MAKKSKKSKSVKPAPKKTAPIAKSAKNKAKSKVSTRGKTKTEAKPSRVKKQQPKKKAPPKKSTKPVPKKVVPKATPKATPKAAKPKKPAKKSGTPYCPKGYTPQEYEKFLVEKNRLSGYSNAQLKDILRKNLQSMSGNKDDLVLKVADGIVLGRIPRCPNCFGGR